MRRVLVLLVVSFSFLASSTDVSEGFKSIQWQKVELQEKIYQKVKKTIGSLVEENDYIVEVDVSYYAPPKPNFEKDRKPEVKISEKEFKDSSRDYIVFSKLGLEVPTVANNRKVEQKKLTDVWKFHEANNIFNNLEGVTIFIYLEKSIKEATVNSIKSLLGNLKLPIGDIVAEVEIEKIPLKENRVGKALPKKVKPKLSEYIIDNLAKFSTMLGLVLSTLIMLLGGLLLFRKYKHFKENEKAKEMIANSANNLQDDKEEDSSQAGGMPGFPSMDGNSDDTQLVGFSRFEKFITNSPDEAIHMIKRWVNESTKDSFNALNAIVKQLDNDVLLKVFSNLGAEERNVWKANLDDNLSLEDIKKANEFISNQIVAEIIVPHVLRDYELLDTLLTLTPAEGVKFINENDQYRGVFMNIVNPRFFSRIAERLDDDILTHVIDESIKFEEFDEGKSYDDFKQKLEGCRVVKKQKPFVKKIIDLMGTATPKVEKSLYDALISEKEFETVSALAKKNFPSFLVKDSSNEALEPVIKSYPMKKRVELLSLDNPEFNLRLIEIFAPEGTKARDFLDIEMQLASENLELKRKIKESSDQIYFEFVAFFREYLESNDAVREEISTHVEAWVKSFQGDEKSEDLEYAS